MDDDAGDVLTITNDLDDTVRNLYPNDSPQMIFGNSKNPIIASKTNDK